MRNRVQYLLAPPEPKALLRLADEWVGGLHEITGAYRAVSGLAAALAGLSDGGEPGALSLLRSVLAPHPLLRLLRHDPLLAHAWQKEGMATAAGTVIGDLMLRHPDTEPMLRRADEIGRNLFTVTSSLPTASAARGERRLIARLADQLAARQAGLEVLAVAPGHMREAEASQAGPAGRIRRWVGLVQERGSFMVIGRSMPLPYVTPIHASVMAMLLRPDILGSFDLVYCKALERLTDAEAEALAAAAFARVRPGGRMLLTGRAPGAADLAFWTLDGHAPPQLRDEARLARLVSALTPGEVAHCGVLSGVNDAMVYLEVGKA